MAKSLQQYTCEKPHTISLHIAENSSLPTESEIETEATETDQDSGDSVIDRYE